MKKLIIFIVVVLSFVTIGAAFAFVYTTRQYEQKIEQISDQISSRSSMYLHGTLLTDYVESMIVTGKSEKIFKFYDQFTKNRVLSFLLISNAISNNLPIDLVMAVAHEESEYCVNCEHKNKNGSIDYSVMQLNSKTFFMYTREYLMIPSNNIRLGVNKLREDYEKYSGSLLKSLIVYNSGDLNGVSSDTVTYADDILQYESYLDKVFNEDF